MSARGWLLWSAIPLTLFVLALIEGLAHAVR